MAKIPPNTGGPKMRRNWTDEEIEKAAKKTIVRMKILAAKNGVTLEEVFERLLQIAESDKNRR